MKISGSKLAAFLVLFNIMFPMEKYISQSVKVIKASGIRKVFALGAQLKDPINLSIGKPHFDVPEEQKSKVEFLKNTDKIPDFLNF